MWFSKPLKSILSYNGQLRERGTAGGTVRGTERKIERQRPVALAPALTFQHPVTIELSSSHLSINQLSSGD